MAKIQLGKFKANGQEYQKLQINRTLGPSIGDQAYLGRFSSHDGNHSLALSIHDVIADTIAQYKIFSSLNVANGVWSEVEPTSKLDKQDIVVSTRTDGPVISIRVTRVTKALGSKEYQVKCLNLRPVMETYLREVEIGLDGEYGQGYITPRPMPQVQLDPRSQIPPVPPMAPAPGKPMPANGIDTAVLFKMLMDHMAAPAPHVSHEIIARKNRPFGYAGLDGRGMLPAGLIPAKAKLTIRIGNDVVVYDGTTDVDLSFTNSGLMEDLGVSVAANLNSSSAATDDDIAGLFDDDPMTPPLAQDDPGLIIDDDTVVNNGNQSQGGSQSTDNQSTSSHQCANGCYCSGGTNEECQCGDGCCTTSTSGNEQTPAEQQPAEQQPAEQTPGNHSCQCSCSSAGQQQSQQPQYGGYPYGYPPQYMVPPMYGTHFPPPPPPPPFPPFSPNQPQQPPQNSSGCSCNCNCNNGGNTNPNPNPAPEPELYSLTLNKNVADSGAVEGSGEYAANASVPITATPGEGFVFIKWSDENTSPSRTIIMPAADTEYTAYFGYTLTVSSNDDNMGTASGSGNFLPNEETTIEARPSEGYHLLRWSDLNSDNKVRSVTVSDNLDIIAYFEEDIRQYTVTLTKNKDDYGEVTGTGVYNEGEDVTITAIPNSGYKFVKWSDDVEEAERTFEDIHEDINLQAEFKQLDMISVTAAIKPNANYGRVEGTGDYERGTVITLTAIANPGYKFVKWMTGDALAYSRTYTDNPLEHTITSSIDFRAYFEIDNSSPEYTLSLHTNDESLGTVEGAGEYPEGAEVSIAANPIGDNVFVRWNDDNTENPRTITMPGEDTWYVAYFGDTSSGEITEVEGEHPEDTKMIRALPAEGYHFVRWNDDNQENPRIVPAALADTFTAVFEPDFENPQLDVSVNSEDRGSVNDVGGIYEPFAHVQLLATPKTGFAFMGWSDGISENPRTVVMDDSYNIKALFDVQYYTLTLLKDVDEHGTFEVDPQGPYTYNQSVSITPVGTEGYHFLRWDDYLDDSPRIVKMIENKTMTAFFERNSYTLTLRANDDTMCESLTGAGTYVGDEPFQISAKAKDGFMFMKWDDECDQATRIYSLTSDTTLTAIFDILKYYITVAVPPSNVSMVSLEGEGYYLPNTQATLKVTVLPGNAIIFDKWNDGNTDNPRTVTVTSDKTYTASFAISRNVTLSVNDSSMGTIQTLVNGEVVNEGTGVVTLKSGIQAVFKAIPTEGFAFKNWSGLMDDSTNPRPVNINGNYTIQANFEKAYYTITVRSNDISTGYVTGPELAVDPETGEPLGEQQSGTNKFTPGSQVVITATPANTYYRFVNWNDGNQEDRRTITVSGNDTYTAYFELDTFRIKVTSNNISWGTVQLDTNNSDNSKIRSVEDDGTYVVDRNATLTFIAKAETSDGYRFAYWSDNESMTSERRSFSATSDKTITAIFARESYNVNLGVATNSSNAGTGTVHIEQGDSNEPVTGPFVGDSLIRLVAIPDEGYEFNYWSDNTSNHENPREYLVTKNVTINAYFTGKLYTVTARSEDTGKGSVSLYRINNPNSSTVLSSPATVAYGTTIKLKASPATGYAFKEWNDYNNSAERTYQIPAHDSEFIAYFEPLKYTLELESNNPDYGYVEGAGSHDCGSVFTIRAIANEGYEFSKWSDNIGGEVRDYTMPAKDVRLVATFVAKQYDLTVNKNDTGRSDWVGATISNPAQSMSNIAGAGAKKAVMGAAITLTPNPANGGVFVKWDDNTTGVKEFSMPAHNVTMAAYFGQSVSCELSGMYDGCEVTGTGNYMQGDTVTLRAVPASGYDFFSWDDGDISRTKTFIVGNTNINRTATFYNISNPPSRLIIRDIENPSAKVVTVTDSTTSTTTTLTPDDASAGTSDYSGYILWPGVSYKVKVAYRSNAQTNQGFYFADITAPGNGSPVTISPVVLVSLTANNKVSTQGISSVSNYALLDNNYSGYNPKNVPTMSFDSTRKILLKTLDILTTGTSDDTYDLVLYGSNDNITWTSLCSSNQIMRAADIGTNYTVRHSGSWYNFSLVRRMAVNASTPYYHYKLVCSSATYSQPVICELKLSEAYWVD